MNERVMTILTGPSRKLPDRRAHEVFEDQARARPEAIAAMHGSSQLTYGELNARANQVARALLARGLTREGVVGVVTERNLDWMTAVLAIFKAGGAYLPIEPHFPAERIARTLSRAGCRLVLTERGSTAMLDQALLSLSPSDGERDGVEGRMVETLFIDEAYTARQSRNRVGRDGFHRVPRNFARQDGDAVERVPTEIPSQESSDLRHPAGDLGLDVAPDQLAYIYFTSGSTGEPKGAMCEHAGLLNHLLAKVEDLKIGEGTVVAQTAPQCFDISLWQLISALLVGGRTLIIEQETILDARRFIDRIMAARVNVVQVVPSYLEVLVSYLSQHRSELKDLRYVVATGEALKKELVERWFAVQPRIKLVNAYGLTETSDDTNHEIMDHVPDAERVSLGRPINNVLIYVVDEQLQPVPLGEPGEIVFSGVCVGRGYINDPERTQRAFLQDPLCPGQRMYRSGDYGRGLPGGKLEFLGRRDSQVKISGFRIEIGEIENQLLKLPGVREAAVVVTEGADQNKHLVAFCSGDPPLEPRSSRREEAHANSAHGSQSLLTSAATVQGLNPGAMRDQLAKALPAYMVPSAIHWRKTLPLTENGKIDRKALLELAAVLPLSSSGGEGGGEEAVSNVAGELDVPEQRHEQPSTATERRLAAAWAQVLGIPEDQIGRRDHFFELGGVSLSALRLAIALERAVSFKDLTAHPILADQAALIDERTERGVLAAPQG
jgi:amino acid adenylation domain-containing protein